MDMDEILSGLSSAEKLVALVSGWTNDGKMKSAIEDLERDGLLRTLVRTELESLELADQATQDQVVELQRRILTAVETTSGKTTGSRIAGEIAVKTGDGGTAVGLDVRGQAEIAPGTRVIVQGGTGARVTGVSIRSGRGDDS